LSMSVASESPCLSARVFDDKQYYTVAQAARRGAISRSTLYQEMQLGNLPYVKCRSSRRLVGADLNDFLARGYHAGQQA
jgi:excisionase family DNA binding protein